MMKREKIKFSIFLLVFIPATIFVVSGEIRTYKTTGCIGIFQEARPRFEKMPRGVSFTADEVTYTCSWSKKRVSTFIIACLFVLYFGIWRWKIERNYKKSQPTDKELAEDEYETSASGRFTQFCLITCDNCNYQRLIYCFGRVGKNFGGLKFDTFTRIKYCKNCRLIYQLNPAGHIYMIKERWWEKHYRNLDEFLADTPNQPRRAALQEISYRDADIQEIHEDFDQKNRCACNGELVEYEYKGCLNCSTKDARIELNLI